MSDDIFYSIGEMAEICDIPAKTLRYYDEIGLLKPDYVDPETRYRYYSNRKIMDIITIKGLKARDFSLKEVEAFIKTQNPSKLIDLYKYRETEISKKIDDLQKAQDRLKRRISLFEKYFSNNNTDEYEIKNLDGRYFVCDINNAIIDEKNLAAAFNRIQKRIKRHKLHTFTPITFIFNEIPVELKDTQTNYEVCSPLSKMPDKKLKFIKTIDKGLFACLTAKMGLFELPEKCSSLISYIKDKNYIRGQNVIIQFLVSFIHTKSFDDVFCEIQIPVRSTCHYSGNDD